LNITVRVTLVEKCAEAYEKKAYIDDRIEFYLSRDDADSSWHGYCYIDEYYTYGRYQVLLTDAGDSWEKTFHVRPKWDIELPRGKNVTAKLGFWLSLEEFPANETDPAVVPMTKRNLIHITEFEMSAPMTITFFRPFISAFEVVAGIGAVAVSGLGIAFALYYRSRMQLVTRAFSLFVNQHPFLVNISCCVVIAALWFSLIPLLNLISITFSQIFPVALLAEASLIFASVVLSVGLFELMLEEWDLMQIGLGLLGAIFLVSLLYLMILYLSPS
jgi:hypothetical protein